MCEACVRQGQLLQGSKGPKAAMVLQQATKSVSAFPLSLAGLKKIPLIMADPLCTDDLSSADSGGDGCDWYYAHTDSCGVYDSDSFNAAAQCCACGRPADAVVSITEPEVAACENTATGLDRGWDGCDWYDTRPGACGMHDDEDFIANEHCCGCGGGRNVTVAVEETVCEDTAAGAVDAGGDSCSWYSSYADSCGAYDDEDFVASQHCCACGGGRTETSGETPIEEAAEEIAEEIAEVISDPEEVAEVVEEVFHPEDNYRGL